MNAPSSHAPAINGVREPGDFLILARAEVAAQQAEQDRVNALIYAGYGHTLRKSYDLTGACDRFVIPRVETVEAVEARLRQEADRIAAWEASPRGRFYHAVQRIREISYFEEAHQLEGIYRRSLADDREPLNTEAVGAALTILNKVPGRDARAAIEALAELLLADRDHRRAA